MTSPYQLWLDRITSSHLAEPGASPSLPPELDLQSHWYQGGFGLEFYTTTGQHVIIHYLGEWNRAAGPDFKECLIHLDGEELKGDIELDHSPAEWEQHGHATNPAFDNVILHVSFSCSSTTMFCRTSTQREVPQIHITELPENLIIREPQTLPGFCATEFATWSAGQIDALLRASARHRLDNKAQRLSRQIQAVGIHETLWQALATTLGYRPNARAMHLLSQRIKADQVKHLGDQTTRLATLLGTADFLSPSLHHSAPSETQEYLEELWQHWWRERHRFELTPDRRITWTMHGQRPVNHPHRRVAALALLWPRLQLISQAMQAPTAQRLKELEKELLGISDPFWSHHYTLTSQRSEKSLSLFGKDKFRELVSNFLVPIWYLTDQQGAFDYYTTLRSSTKNEQVRRSVDRLFSQRSDTKSLVKHTYQHQALQQLYHDFCLRHGCLQCPFPKL